VDECKPLILGGWRSGGGVGGGGGGDCRYGQSVTTTTNAAAVDDDSGGDWFEDGGRLAGYFTVPTDSSEPPIPASKPNNFAREEDPDGEAKDLVQRAKRMERLGDGGGALAVLEEGLRQGLALVHVRAQLEQLQDTFKAQD